MVIADEQTCYSCGKRFVFDQSAGQCVAYMGPGEDGKTSGHIYWCAVCAKEVDPFDRDWARLAESGVLESAEGYDRIRRRWEAAGRPEDAAAFIRREVR